MDLPRRTFPKAFFPILLAAGVVGLVLTRRPDGGGSSKLPEDLTASVKKAQAEREQAIAVLMTAPARGLKLADYWTGGDVAPALANYARDVRYGRSNPGLYEKPLGEVAATTEDALRQLDPPFAEYRRLEQALITYRQRAETDITALEQVAQIERTLERWRWLPREFPNGAILVNVPSFELNAFGPEFEAELSMRVVVGKARGHQTPLFTAALKHVVFGPYWNVPDSILRDEILPDVTRDRTYLGRNAYEVVGSDGSAVRATGEASDEVLEGLRSGALRVRQVPGTRNALGRVKFLFPNENAVYLHDTPSRSLFARERRDFSHGCVRVENPQALAEWVLRREEAWPTERIAAALKQSKSVQVNVQNPIPVFMVYHTVTVNAAGEAQFWPDLYNVEAATTAARAPRPRE